MKKFVLFLVVGLIGIIIFFIVEEVIEEKYCYNLAFTELDKRGIKLGEVPADFPGKGFSPIEVASTPGQREWKAFYLGCKGGFNLLNMDISELGKSYPYYKHFIDW